MRLKDSAIPKGLKPQALLAMIIMDEVYKEDGYRFVVTSLNDSKHRDNSYHYDGYAFDCRVRSQYWQQSHYPDEDNARLLVSLAKERLGPCYDVIYEGNHIHCEYNARDYE